MGCADASIHTNPTLGRFVYFLSIAGLVGSIAMNECPRCANFDCSHNAVPEEVRKAHLGDAA